MTSQEHIEEAERLFAIASRRGADDYGSFVLAQAQYHASRNTTPRATA